jgi:hypothetical protein
VPPVLSGPSGPRDPDSARSRENGSRRAVTVSSLTVDRRSQVKTAFSTRRVPDQAQRTLVMGPLRPRSGDLVLARIDRIGQHGRIELSTGRRARIHVGDEVIVAYGDRYATDFYEVHVPPNLRATHLVAAGGIAGRMVSRSRGVRRPTDITPLGLIGDERGTPLNLVAFGLPPTRPAISRPPVLAVVGTSMNSGKTTAIRYLVNGLRRGGYRPGAAKVTGTGSGNDYWVMIDAGAHRMLDFTDVGFSSTYRVPVPILERTLLELVDHLSGSDCEAILLELADGLYQQETAQLIDSDAFRSSVDGVIFAAGEAMGAANGVARLRELGLPVVGVSGVLTASPLASREAELACELPVFGIEQLRDPVTAARLLGLTGRTPIAAASIPIHVQAEGEPTRSELARTPAWAIGAPDGG